jgi:methylated-DNA-[protein]-cysteine S-methyltransferase
LPQLSLHSPLGSLTLTQEDDAIVALDWGWGSEQTETPLLCAARDELHAYFDGELARFTVRLAPVSSTPYRHRVWSALQSIPFGETRTYAELARVAGGSARSIGQANSRNPLPILIPCHRVVATTHLGGFSMEGGLDTKRFLLSLETAGSPARRAADMAA